jgi:hydroxyethylthiazole kinase-like uncharacterized protein yjeF
MKPSINASMHPTIRTLHLDTLPARLPARAADCHKGHFGHVGIVGGAVGMAGAAILAGRAALFCGAGRVTVGLLDERIGLDPNTPELMLAAPVTALHLAAPACVVIGPGLGNSGAARGWLEQALHTQHPLLLDADALNLIAADPGLGEMLASRTQPALITPHPGEAARLLGVSSLDRQSGRQNDRIHAISALAERYRVSVVLKGHASLILRQDGQLWRNTTGNAGMAAPGMGDVLCGIIAALCAQGLSLDDAAVHGVWLPGAAGDRAVMQRNTVRTIARAGTQTDAQTQPQTGPVGLTASELIVQARQLINEMG